MKTNARSTTHRRPIGPRARARAALDELVDDGDLTLDDRLRIEAAAAAAREAGSSPTTSPRRRRA